MGDELTWVCTYSYKGKSMGLHIKAKSAEEAKDRLEAIGQATVDGMFDMWVKFDESGELEEVDYSDDWTIWG